MNGVRSPWGLLLMDWCAARATGAGQLPTTGKGQDKRCEKSGQDWPVAPSSITCKRKASRGDWDTSVVSVVDTPMLKRLPRVRVLGATRSGRLPRVPDGWLGLRLAGATGPMDWRHGQVLPGYVAASGDVMCCSSRWAARVADGYRDRACEPTTLPKYVVRFSETARVGRIITPGQSESGSRPDSE
ncbi:hypothetical protein TIFTF001_031944 [Ficus carica]|uniref:Secreted protein n=1 Tax=Ficus carica TaxID=3494 RepID=A0AA88J5W0_FICCA|nr:hypothetical protein TIFTF001_031944 [Ficus carica]